ncbi:hypothetical protein HYX58_02910 [Candidatus Dependentiae bacterium]|nr:hypothetical protein [Candidatus Dependentiae bacterium]
MMHTSGMRLMCMIVCLITALGSIHLGLMALGYNPLEMLHIMQYEKIVYYIIGACGVIALLKLVMGACSSHCGCHCGSSCDHKHK